MGLRFLKISVVYLVLGALLGFGMGIAQSFVLVPVHAHLVLLGWASMALAGLVYHFYPAASITRLARWHFWLHNIGLPLFMAGLAFVVTGNESALPVVIVGATTVIVGLVLFAANVLVNIRPAPQAT
jgi:cbb3-type cytochrome oxidase subunit 1